MDQRLGHQPDAVIQPDADGQRQRQHILDNFDYNGETVVQEYKVSGMGHGTAVDPGSATDQCGSFQPVLPQLHLLHLLHGQVLGSGWLRQRWLLEQQLFVEQ